MEASVIGSFLINPSTYFEYNDILVSDMFTGDHKSIANALFTALDEKGEIDIQNFAYEVNKENPRIKDTYVTGLVQYGSASSLEKFCKELKRLYLNNQEKLLASKTISRLADGEDAELIINEIGAEREMIIDRITKREDNRLGDMMEVYDNAIAAMNNPGVLTGIPTGFNILNKLFNGWQPTNDTVIAGRPAMGKSSIGLQIAMTAAINGFPAGYISLEMSKIQLYRKMVSINTSISVDRITSGDLTESEAGTIHDEIQRMYSLPIYVEDRVYNIDKIINLIRVWKRRYGIKLVVIDYVQLADTTKEKEDTQRVSEVSRKLNLVAKTGDCNLSMIKLAQLNRDVEKRANKRPQLSDLKNSGSLEQDADEVIFLYRDEYYKIIEYEDGTSTKGKAEIITAKNRHGKLGMDIVGFEGRFFDLK